MSFVPFVPPSAPSPRTDELGGRLKETVDSFRRDHPELSDAEIRQAMELAAKGTRAKHPAALVLLMAGFALLGVLVFRLVGRVLPAVGQTPILTILVVACILAIAIAALIRNR